MQDDTVFLQLDISSALIPYNSGPSWLSFVTTGAQALQRAARWSIGSFHIQCWNSNFSMLSGKSRNKLVPNKGLRTHLFGRLVAAHFDKLCRLGFGRWTACFPCRAMSIVGHLVHWWCHLLFLQCGTICPFGPILGSMLGGPGPQREHSQELHPLLLRLPSCYSLSSKTTSCHAVYVLGFEASSGGRWWSHAPRISSQNLGSVLMRSSPTGYCRSTRMLPDMLGPGCFKLLSQAPSFGLRVVPVSPSCLRTACSTCYTLTGWMLRCASHFVARPTNYTRLRHAVKDLAPELLQTLGLSTVGTMEVAGANPVTTPDISLPNFVEPSPNQSRMWSSSSEVSHGAWLMIGMRGTAWLLRFGVRSPTRHVNVFHARPDASLPTDFRAIQGCFHGQQVLVNCSVCSFPWHVVGLWAGSYWRVEMFARWCLYEFFRILQRIDTFCFSMVSGPYFSLQSSAGAFWKCAFLICVDISSLSATSLQSQDSCLWNVFAS